MKDKPPFFAVRVCPITGIIRPFNDREKWKRAGETDHRLALLFAVLLTFAGAAMLFALFRIFLAFSGAA